MTSEQAGHARAEGNTYGALGQAIALARVGCEALADDAMIVRIDHATDYESDALVRCDPRAPGNADEALDPINDTEVDSRLFDRQRREARRSLHAPQISTQS